MHVVVVASVYCQSAGLKQPQHCRTEIGPVMSRARNVCCDPPCLKYSTPDYPRPSGKLPYPRAPGHCAGAGQMRLHEGLHRATCWFLQSSTTSPLPCILLESRMSDFSLKITTEGRRPTCIATAGGGGAVRPIFGCSRRAFSPQTPHSAPLPRYAIHRNTLLFLDGASHTTRHTSYEIPVTQKHTLDIKPFFQTINPVKLPQLKSGRFPVHLGEHLLHNPAS
jgi:hypothetical protein